jgi:hypothetical protein
VSEVRVNKNLPEGRNSNPSGAYKALTPNSEILAMADNPVDGHIAGSALAGGAIAIGLFNLLIDKGLFPETRPSEF